MLLSTEGLPGPVIMNRFGNSRASSVRDRSAAHLAICRAASDRRRSGCRLQQRTGHRIEAGREYDGCRIRIRSRRPSPCAVISLIGVLAHIDQRHVVPVVSPVVVGVDEMRLVPMGWFFGASSSAVAGSADVAQFCLRTNSAAVSLACGSMIRSLKAAMNSVPPAAHRFLIWLPLFVRDLERRLVVRIVAGCRYACAAPFAQRGIMGFPRLAYASRHRPVARRDAEFGVRWNTVRCAACLAITGIAWIADEPVPITPTRIPVKSTPSCGQCPVWYTLAGKALDPREIRHPRGGQAAGRHHAVARRHDVATDRCGWSSDASHGRSRPR